LEKKFVREACRYQALDFPGGLLDFEMAAVEIPVQQSHDKKEIYSPDVM
jgi:hypothetical protein